MNIKLEFFYCDLCKGVSLKCPRCGNNSCNGASGKAIPDNFPAGLDDKKCLICSKVYALERFLQKSDVIQAIEELLLDKDITIPNE